MYDTLEQVDRMTLDAEKEKDSREAALELLFNTNHDDVGGAMPGIGGADSGMLHTS